MANGNGGGELEKLNTLFNTVVRAMRGAGGQGRATPAEIQALIQEEDPRFTTPQEIVERIRQIESAPDLLGGVALSALQGISFDFLDEAIGFVAGEEAKEELRRQTRAFRRERPKTAFVSEMAGGFVVPGLGAGRTAQTIRQAAARGALIGAGEGAIAGAGAAEGGVVERLVGAGTGAAFGGAAGGLLAGGTRGAVQAFRGLTGRTGQTAAESAREFAQEVVGETPRGIEGTLEELARMQELVPEARLADVPEARPILEAATTTSTRARAEATSVLPPRAKSARERVETDLLENLGVDAPPSARARAESIQTKIQRGSEAYEGLARTVGKVDDEVIDDLLVNTAVREVMPSVNRRLRRAGIETPKLIKKGAEGAIERTDNLPSFRQLQGIKLQLDDEVSSLYRAGRPGEAGELARFRDEFREGMEEAVSGFGDAQQRWMQVMREKDGLEAGMQFISKQSDDIAADLDRFADFPEAEAAYREGAVASLIQRLRGQVRRGDVSRFFDTAEMDAKLSMLFPDEGGFQRFLDQLDIEREMQATVTAGLGGSPTARRLNLTEFLSAPTGRRTVQRVAESPFAPGIALSRLAGELQQRALTERGRRRAGEVGGLLGEAVLAPGQVSARRLLTGGVGSLGTSLNFLTRTPRALLLAMRGQE